MPRIKILVIDDEKPFTWMLKLQLEKTGEFEVFAEHDPFLALARARECKPDLILLDIVMPGKDGGDVRDSLSKDPVLCGIQVLMISALVSNDDASPGAIIQSADDVILPKPVSTAKLLAAIEQRLAGVI